MLLKGFLRAHAQNKMRFLGLFFFVVPCHLVQRRFEVVGVGVGVLRV